MDLLGGVFFIVVVVLAVVCVILGLLLAHVNGRRQCTTGQVGKTQGEGTGTGSESKNIDSAQLNRIEALIQKTDFNSTRLWIRAIGLTAIIFAGTGIPGVPPTFDTWMRLIIFILGGIAMFAPFKQRQNK